MASKKRNGGRQPCPFPGCGRNAEHDGDHRPRGKVGNPGTPRWTPGLRAFVEQLKQGKAQTEAYHIAFPNDQNPAQHATVKIRHPLVTAAMTEYEENRKAAEKIRASISGAIAGRAEGLKRAEHMEILASIARNETVAPQARISAVMGSAQLKGMLVKQTRNLTDKFEGFTDLELEQYSKDGTVPERFAIRFGVTPGGSSSVM